MAKVKRWTWAKATRECPLTVSLLEAVTKKLMTAEEIRDALITIAGVMREARRAEKKARRKKETR